MTREAGFAQVLAVHDSPVVGGERCPDLLWSAPVLTSARPVTRS
ncbi:hypothetical protein N801_13275 [Knoellia aerolata DSM 18566]|uniref:Uncharacterized protein n=1 Tax=Knoellia aerolata DSM 18566 TaxID=1385519 RepID=A0A0A0JWU2_9MICO|nr:hypothetical protein N801_13275 [Knoellia aerolata DSM 18566]